MSARNERSLPWAFYHEEHRYLDISMPPNKSGHIPIYRYFDVPRETYGELLFAPSPARFFATYIRNKFRFERLT